MSRAESRVLVTGATGFVGQAVTDALRGAGYRVRRALRRVAPECAEVEDVVVGELDGETEWEAALDEVQVVVHLAAHVHVMHSLVDPEPYRRVNVDGTSRLARAAARRGVRRMVFMSSVKVHGEASHERPFREADPPSPLDLYAASKWDAERALMDVGAATGLETAILRPPLVYGPGVKANFLTLMKAVDRGIPLPFGAVANRRGLVYVGNLADAVVCCVRHPAAAGETFLVSDGPGMSTPELIRAVAAALHRPARLLPVPLPMLQLLGRVTGRATAMERLCGSLAVDGSKLTERCDWRPPFSVAEGLARTAEWFHAERTDLDG